MNKNFIFHICERHYFETFMDKVYYHSKTFKEEGFIHCCFKSQIEHVLDSYFHKRENLILIKVDINLVEDLKIEGAHDGVGPFPHLYNGIPLKAIVEFDTIATLNK